MILEIYATIELIKNKRFYKIYNELINCCYYKYNTHIFYLNSDDGLYLLLKYPEYLREKSKKCLKSRFNK